MEGGATRKRTKRSHRVRRSIERRGASRGHGPIPILRAEKRWCGLWRRSTPSPSLERTGPGIGCKPLGTLNPPIPAPGIAMHARGPNSLAASTHFAQLSPPTPNPSLPTVAKKKPPCCLRRTSPCSCLPPSSSPRLFPHTPQNTSLLGSSPPLSFLSPAERGSRLRHPLAPLIF